MYLKIKLFCFAVVMASQFIYAETFSASNRMEGFEFCKRNRFYACIPQNVPKIRGQLWDWPAKNGEEYDQVCLYATTYMPCMINHSKVCGNPEQHHYTVYLEKKYAAYQDFCNAELPIYNVIRSNAKCMSNAWEDGNCTNNFKEARTKWLRFEESEKYKPFLIKNNISECAFFAIALGLISHLKEGCRIKYAEMCGNNPAIYLIKGMKALQYYDYSTEIFQVDDYLPVAESIMEALNFNPEWQRTVKNVIKLQRIDMTYIPIPGHLESWIRKNES